MEPIFRLIKEKGIVAAKKLIKERGIELTPFEGKMLTLCSYLFNLDPFQDIIHTFLAFSYKEEDLTKETMEEIGAQDIELFGEIKEFASGYTAVGTCEPFAIAQARFNKSQDKSREKADELDKQAREAYKKIEADWKKVRDEVKNFYA